MLNSRTRTTATVKPCPVGHWSPTWCPWVPWRLPSCLWHLPRLSKPAKRFCISQGRKEHGRASLQRGGSQWQQHFDYHKENWAKLIGWCRPLSNSQMCPQAQKCWRHWQSGHVCLSLRSMKVLGLFTISFSVSFLLAGLTDPYSLGVFKK